jgi:rRNA-processing protein FCF1
MMQAQFSVDLIDELRRLLGAFEPLVLDSVVNELAGLSAGKGRDGAAARHGLEIARRCTLVRAENLPAAAADSQVIDYAHRNGCLVVTNDRDLRDALLVRGVGVISMRKQKRLELVQK